MNGVANWDDIPYAQPPVGDLRWKAPREILKNKLQSNPKLITFAYKNQVEWVGQSLMEMNFFWF